jgi:hypothetical protein
VEEITGQGYTPLLIVERTFHEIKGVLSPSTEERNNEFRVKLLAQNSHDSIVGSVLSDRDV